MHFKKFVFKHIDSSVLKALVSKQCIQWDNRNQLNNFTHYNFSSRAPCYVNRWQCAVYALPFSIVVATCIVTEIVKMIQKHKDPDITQKLFKQA